LESERNKKKEQSLDVTLVEDDSPIPLDHSASPVCVGDFPVAAPGGDSTLSQIPEMYEQMYVSMGSAFSSGKCVTTPVKMRVKSPWIERATPSVDYAFYDAYRADSWAGAGARAHRGLPAGGRELSAAT
jgi:hypothetical protein